jgi:putative membrane protein
VTRIQEVPATGTAPRRTSPRIVLVHTVTFRQARSLVPAVLGLGAAVGVKGGTAAVVALAVAVSVVSLMAAALSWWRFSYVDGPTAVVVTRGLLARSVRTVPNDRIRGVEVEAPALHRLFGLARVRIDAAAGAVAGKHDELVIDGVTRAEGHRLRARLLSRPRPAGEPTPAPVDGGAPPPPDEEVVARFDNRWLLYAPLVGSYLAVPLAAVGALFRFTDDLPENLRPHLGQPDLSDARVVVAVLLVTVLLLVVGSIVGAAVVNWGFLLVRRGGSLLAVRGLITQRHTELEIDRIRGCTVLAGVGMRVVGAARVNALVTGLGDAARRGQLLPLGPRAEAWRLARRLVDDPGELARHPRAARRRRIVRAVSAGVVVTAAGLVAFAVAGWWWLAAVGVGLGLLGVPLGLARYAALGHRAGPRSVAVRGGWLVREEAVLQRRAVVGWRVHQSFFQRRAGLATVTACVGAGSGGYSALDMAADEVAEFAAAASSGTWAQALRA